MTSFFLRMRLAETHIGQAQQAALMGGHHESDLLADRARRAARFHSPVSGAIRKNLIPCDQIKPRCFASHTRSRRQFIADDKHSTVSLRVV
jgi:hypothetical protein